MKFELKELPIDKVKPDKEQPRKTFDEEALQHLSESILSNGLLNPIEVDEDYVITDGERRWRACKVAGIKTISARIVPNKDKTEKLRRQLIFTLQDEEIPTEERYSAIVKLYEMIKKSGPDFCKELGISESMFKSAKEYCNFVEEEPELAKTVAPHIVIETASLPKEERKEVLKEFEGTKDKKKDLIRELVKEKRQRIEMDKKAQEIQKSNQSEIKIKHTEEMLNDLKNQIDTEFNRINKLMYLVGRVKKTKLYMSKPKEKETFFRYLDGIIKRVETWSKDLRNLKENLELEIIST